MSGIIEWIKLKFRRLCLWRYWIDPILVKDGRELAEKIRCAKGEREYHTCAEEMRVLEGFMGYPTDDEFNWRMMEELCLDQDMQERDDLHHIYIDMRKLPRGLHEEELEEMVYRHYFRK